MKGEVEMKMYIYLMVCMLFALFFEKCGGIPDKTVSEGNSTIDHTITKNGITFYEYTDSLVKRWGFDGASCAISVPGDAQYRCGLVVKRAEQEENYAEVKIQADPPLFISTILPNILQMGFDTVTLFPFTTTGKVTINVYGGNSDLVGKKDYWGGVLHSIDAYMYSPIIYENLPDSMFEYYLLFDYSKYSPSASELKIKMNEVVQQAVINIDGVQKTDDYGMQWDGLVFPLGYLEYVFTDSLKYNSEFKWILDHFGVLNKPYISRIFHVPMVVFCWRTNRVHNAGATQIEIELAQGTELINKDTKTYYFGYLGNPNLDEVEVVSVQSNIITIKNPLQNNHPIGDLFFESYFATGGFSRHELNCSFVRDHKEALIHNICHEFMHQDNNGDLKDIYDIRDTLNLMYHKFYGNIVNNKLRYKTISGEKQWDDVHGIQ